MSWVDDIFSLVWDISSFFYDAYIEVEGWIWPFYLLNWPLYLLYKAFHSLLEPIGHFGDWVDAVADKLSSVFSIAEITAHFSTWIGYATDAWDWISNAWWNVIYIVGDWWADKKVTVQGWIDIAKEWALDLIDAIGEDLAKLWENVQWFFDNLLTFDEIIEWWKDWLGLTAAAMLRWGFVTALDIAGLITTAFIEREDFWAGWQDWKDMVADFFEDPLEFLWELFTDWFVGPEE